MTGIGLFAAAWLVLAASSAGAQELMEMAAGAAVANTVTIGDKQVPLPGGRVGTAYLDPRREDFVLAVKDVGARLNAAIDRGLERKLAGWVSDIELTFE